MMKAEMQHGDVIITLQYHISTFSKCAANVRLFVFYLSTGLVWVCEIELSHMGKNNRNLNLVLENVIYQGRQQYSSA